MSLTAPLPGGFALIAAFPFALALGAIGTLAAFALLPVLIERDADLLAEMGVRL